MNVFESQTEVVYFEQVNKWNSPMKYFRIEWKFAVNVVFLIDSVVGAFIQYFSLSNRQSARTLMMMKRNIQKKL